MAIGLPGIRVGGPLFITGEPRREFNFQFRLSPSHLPNTATPLGWTRFLFSPLFLLYVSGLAEKVTIPPSKFSMGNVQLSTLQFPFPKGFETPPISVQYIEDELESVARFHQIWMDNIRRSTEGDNYGGLQFAPLGTVCCQLMYAPSKKIPVSAGGVGLEVPLGGDIFPFVFPSEIQRADGNKGGQGISKTNVTYTRVPDISGWVRAEWTGGSRVLTVPVSNTKASTRNIASGT